MDRALREEQLLALAVQEVYVWLDRPDMPHVDAWYRRLTTRPAYREHVMIPFAELRGRLEY